MNKRTTILLLISFFAAVIQAPAADDCMELIRSVYRKLNDAGTPGKCYYLNYTLQLNSRDSSKVRSSSSTTEMLLAGNVLRVKNDELQVYQDAQTAVAINPKSSTILIRKLAPVEKKGSAVQRAFFIQDTVLNSSKVLSCREKITGDGGKEKEITIGIEPGLQKIFPFSRLTFFIDPAKQILKKIIISYLPSQNISQAIMTYHRIDYNHTPPADITKPADSFVFNAKKLLPQYKAYRLQDLR